MQTMDACHAQFFKSLKICIILERRISKNNLDKFLTIDLLKTVTPLFKICHIPQAYLEPGIDLIWDNFSTLILIYVKRHK